MDARLQLRVQRYGWDRAAEHYERCWAKQLRPAQDRLLRMADLQPGESVLELACGTGLVTFPAAEAVGPEGRLVATDLSDAMVEELRRGTAARGFTQVNAERADAETLRFEDEAFDAIICSLGLMYVPDPPASLRAARRVLRPGGRYVAAVWGARRECGWADIFPIVDARVNTEVCPLFFQLGTGGSLEHEMEEAGLREVRSERFSTVLEYASEEEALGAAFLGGPVAMAYSRFDEAVKEEVHAEYLASIAAYRTRAGVDEGEDTPEGPLYEIPGEFLVVRGERSVGG